MTSRPDLSATSATLTVAPNGRLVIPAAARAALGIERGGKVVARLRDGALVLEPFDQAIRRARGEVGRYARGAGPVDELIAQRRAVAALD